MKRRTVPVSETAAASVQRIARESVVDVGLNEVRTVMSETDAAMSETGAPVSETPAPVNETPAPMSETATVLSETGALMSETDAPVSEVDVPMNETKGAVSGTATRTSERSRPVSETDCRLTRRTSRSGEVTAFLRVMHAGIADTLRTVGSGNARGRRADRGAAASCWTPLG
ncbi:MAG TPA: hypothetical protein VF765_36685 [Polyangiaceae bacterium]